MLALRQVSHGKRIVQARELEALEEQQIDSAFALRSEAAGENEKASCWYAGCLGRMCGITLLS